jgi:hypothetical protein
LSSNQQLLSAGLFVASDTSEPARSRILVNPRLVLVIGWLATVALSVWLVGTMLEWATYRFDYTEPKLREALNFQEQQFDTVFLGDSLTLEGVNARALDQALGTRSYNLALGGSSMLESEMQLRHFLAHNPKPRLVALGVYVNQPKRPSGVRPSLYFALSPAERKLYARKLQEYEGAKLDRGFFVFNAVSAYRYRNTIDMLLKAALSREPQRPLFVEGQAQAFFSRPVHLGREHDSVLNLAELRSFVSFCRQQNLPLLLFEPPNSPGFPELTRNRNSLLAAIDGIAATQPDLWFVSYGDTGGQYRGQQWLNLNHLNAAGSEQFSAVLATSLRQHLAPDASTTALARKP